MGAASAENAAAIAQSAPFTGLRVVAFMMHLLGMWKTPPSFEKTHRPCMNEKTHKKQCLKKYAR
jgi:hypothetical protein